MGKQHAAGDCRDDGGAGYWVGVDPGRLAGGLGVVGHEGVVYVGWWRAVGRAWEVHRHGPDGEATRRFSTLGGGVRWLVDGWPDVMDGAAVEAVQAFRGKGSPLVLAEAAGLAVGMLEVGGRSVRRPRPEEWREVYTGRRLVVDRDRAKRLALDWLFGRHHVGLRGLELRHPTLAVTLPADVPDHAAEAVGLACWAMGADTRPTMEVRAERGGA